MAKSNPDRKKKPVQHAIPKLSGPAREAKVDGNLDRYQNPLISTSTDQTLINTRNMLCAVERVNLSTSTSEELEMGVFHMLEVCRQALDFEINGRVKGGVS